MLPVTRWPGECEVWWKIVKEAVAQHRQLRGLSSDQEWQPPVLTNGYEYCWNNLWESKGGMSWVLGREETWGTEYKRGILQKDGMDWEPDSSFPDFDFKHIYGRDRRV